MPPKQQKKLHGNLVLSVKQPYATKLVIEHHAYSGIAWKWCENRTWPFPTKLKADKDARLLIHSSKNAEDPEDFYFPEDHVSTDYSDRTAYPRSAIVGSVRYWRELSSAVIYDFIRSKTRRKEVTSETVEDFVSAIYFASMQAFRQNQEFEKYVKECNKLRIDYDSPDITDPTFLDLIWRCDWDFPTFGRTQIASDPEIFWHFFRDPILFKKPIHNVPGALGLWTYKGQSYDNVGQGTTDLD